MGEIHCLINPRLKKFNSVIAFYFQNKNILDLLCWGVLFKENRKEQQQENPVKKSNQVNQSFVVMWNDAVHDSSSCFPNCHFNKAVSFQQGSISY